FVLCVSNLAFVRKKTKNLFQKMMAGGGAAATGNTSGAGATDESTASRMGIIEANDLVYKLQADLSVAINKTQKNGFFQNLEYNNTQTSIAIFNSGADYIDPRRSFLSLTIEIPVTDMKTAHSATTDPLYKAFISCYFGPTGSVLNLIDSIVVSTRSGDELSRVNDF